MAEIDDSKRFFNEWYNLRMNLIKETFEIMGDDYGETYPNVAYHNYLDSAEKILAEQTGNTNYGNDTYTIDWDALEANMENYDNNGPFDPEQIYNIFKKYGAKKPYVYAVIKALDLYGEKVGLTRKGMIVMLGQMAHESGCFKFIKEINGEKASYGRPMGPYGKCYYGRGPIQLTHMSNYKMVSEKYFPKLGIKADIYKNPELCEQNLDLACAATMGWMMIPNNGPLSVKYANAGDIRMCTKMINGGYRGLDERKKFIDLIIKSIGNK